MLAGRSGWRLIGCLAAIVAPGVAAGAAVAQEDGVFVDPDSPAGREYAVPTESARQQGVPDAGDGERETDDAPAFGVGIEAGEDAERGGRDRGEDAPRGGRSGSTSEAREPPASAESRGPAATMSKGAAGLSSGLLTVLVALGVLVVGGVVALLFRAYRSTP